MTLNLMRLVILTISVKKILTEDLVHTVQNGTETNSTNTSEEASEIPAVENTTIFDIDAMSNNFTNRISQERISSHIKRAIPPFPPRHPPFPVHHHRSSHHLLHRRPRSYFNPKSYRKYRRPRKKLSTPPSAITKMLPSHVKLAGPYKRPSKPILLSEVMRAINHYGPSKLKANPFTKDYIEEEDLESIPFAPDSVDAFPPTAFAKFAGRPSMDLHDDSLPPPIEEIIIPGHPSMPPMAGVHRPFMPMPTMPWPGDSKPVYLDDDYQDSVRSVRLAKPYIDKDVVKLLATIKGDAQPAVEPETQPTEVNAAISRLLSPFLSESAVRQIQSYFRGSRQPEERNVTKVVYIIENESKDNVSQDGQYKSYSVTDPLYDQGTNNTTYFIMVKSAESKKSANWSHRTNRHTPKGRGSSTTPSPESVALQNYIMSLAGVGYSPVNYLPHFNSFQKELRNR